MPKGAVNALITTTWAGDKGVKEADRALKRFNRNLNYEASETQKAMAIGAVKTAQFADKITNFGSKVSSFGAVATRNLTLSIAAAGAVALGLAAKYETSMNQVRAASSATATEMEMLDKSARTMGVGIGYGANESAQAILELSKSGMSPAQIQAGGLKSALLLAAAGGLDLDSAARVTSNSLNTFNLKASDATLVANALAGGANASSASVEELEQAFSQVGPGAVNAGLDFNETAGALAAFADNGIKGSDAGTSLKTMLMRLIPQTDASAKAMEKLGLKFTDSKGRFNDISTISQKLQDKLGGLSEAERSKALTTIFGSDATRAATVFMKEGAKGIEKYIAATKERDAAEKMAKAATDGAGGSIKKMKAELESAGITAAASLSPTVISLAGEVKKLASEFSRLSPETQQSVVKFALMAAATGPVLSGLGSLTTTIGGVVKAFSAMQAASALAGISIASVFGVAAVGAGVGLGIAMFVDGIVKANTKAEYASSVFGITRDNLNGMAAAARNAASAQQELAVAQDTAKGAKLSYKSALISEEQAEQAYSATVARTGNKKSLEARQAYNTLQQARLNTKRAAKEQADANEAERQATLKKLALKNKEITAASKNKELVAKTTDEYIRTSGVTGQAADKMRADLDKVYEAGQKGNKKYIDGMKTSKKHLEKLPEGMRTIAQKRNDVIDAWFKLGQNVADGLIKGIDVKTSTLEETTKNLMQAGYTSAAKYARVESPSKLYMKLGGHLIDGLSIGIVAGTAKATSAMKSTATKVVDAWKERISEIKSLSDQYASTWGLFGQGDSVAMGTKAISAGVWSLDTPSLKDRLAGQVSTLTQWKNDMKTLQENGASKGLMTALWAEGPAAAADVAALAQMSKAEIQNVSSLLYQRNTLAKGLATYALGGTAITVGNITINAGSGITEARVLELFKKAIREVNRKG